MIRKLLPLAILFAIMGLVLAFRPAHLSDPTLTLTMMTGFMILVSFGAGDLVSLVGPPRLTGYMLMGILLGPWLLDWLTSEMLADLELIDHLALSLIALSAGRELNFRKFRSLIRPILGLSLFAVLVVVLGILALLLLIHPFIFPSNLTFQSQVLPLIIILTIIAATVSPVTTFAVIDEVKSQSRFGQLSLGLSIFMDIVSIILFTVFLAVYRNLSRPGQQKSLLGTLGWELGGAILIGLILGALMSIYMRFGGHEKGLFLIIGAFLATEMSYRLSTEPLILGLVAGTFIENVSKQGEELFQTIRKGSALIYVFFFAIAGARLDFGALAGYILPVIIILGARTALLVTSIGFMSRRLGEEDLFRRRGWTGLVAQAGVSLIIAVVAAGMFPEIGPIITTLTLAMVAVTSLAGPVLFKINLIGSGG